MGLWRAAGGMQGMRHQLLAGAGFAGDQHGHVAGGGHADLFHQLALRGALPDQLALAWLSSSPWR
jgi:hypothetical protein